MKVSHIAAAVAGSLLALAAPAQAADFDFAFTDGSSNILASGVLHTSDVLNSLGGYDVTGISGTAYGQTIVGLISNPYSPGGAYYFADGHITATPDAGWEWLFDNILFTDGPPYVDTPGLLFETSTNIYNLFYRDGTDILGKSTIGVYGVTLPTGTLSVAPVPESATWALMIVGFGLIGGALRRRQQEVRVRYA